MKSINLLTAVLGFSLLFSCNLKNGDNLSVATKITDAGYDFEASYPEGKTEKVVEYVEKTLSNDQLFLTPSDVKDLEVNLGDSMKFYLKASPGNIEIDFNKNNNSETSYNKLIDLCKGIHKVLR